jgi:hypothetical protein
MVFTCSGSTRQLLVTGSTLCFGVGYILYYSSQDSNTVRFLLNKEMGMAKTDAGKEKKAGLKSFELMVKYC